MLGCERSKGKVLASGSLQSDPSEPIPTNQEISNLELCIVLLVLFRNNQPQPKKKHQTIREPDLFSGSEPDKLQVFLF